jgi:OmpA-OmpF porin, OOP family
MDADMKRFHQGGAVRSVALAVVATLLVVLVSACQPPVKTVVAVGVTATANEPAIALTTKGKATLHEAITQGETRVVIFRSGSPMSVFDKDLTVRRGRDQENNAQRVEDGFAAKLESVQSSLRTAADTTGQLDLFGLLVQLSHVSDARKLLLYSSGLQTTGMLNLVPAGSDFDVDRTVAALPGQSLPDLAGKKVVFAGLGQVAGPQRALPEEMRRNVERLWLGVCRKAGADECSIDPDPVAAGGPSGTKPVPTVAVPEVSSWVVPKGDGVKEVTIPAAVFFLPNSADLQPGATDALRGLTGLFGRGTTATAVGHTATWGPLPGAQDLSLARSRRVVEALIGLGVARAVFTSVTGVGFRPVVEPDIDARGQLIPAAAERNRVVVLTIHNLRNEESS